MDQLEINNVYDLFTRHQYKTLLQVVKKNSDLLDVNINDDKTLIHYAVLINNKKLINKILKIPSLPENKQLLYKTTNNLYLSHIALQTGHYDLFFWLIDKYIKSFDVKLIFNSTFIVNNNEHMTLTHEVIFKKNNNLLNKYIDQYIKYIEWDIYYDGDTYLSLMLINNIDNINNIIGWIKKMSTLKDLKVLYYAKNEIHPLYVLLCMYYKRNNKILQDFAGIKTIKEFILLCPEQINYTNYQNKSAIYIIGEENDIEMMKFCVENGANLNHISQLGYINFFHNIVNKSNLDMIEYILTLDINFNHIDSNNETPIFNLLRNKYFIIDNKTPDDLHKKQINIIIKLMGKTDDWNLQNIYGQSYIHNLFLRTDIKSFYDKLSTKYFDPNLKNKFNSSIIDIFVKTLVNLKKTEIEIKQEIILLKELIVDNYIATIKETNIEIKTNCDNYKYNNPDKKKSICWLNSMSNLSISSLTDIDKLSKNYRDIILEDHQFAHYNLFNARDTDIYFYYIILISKYDNLSVPINNIFDEKETSKTAFINIKTILDISTLNYYQKLLTNIIKYPSLYSLNIYWLNATNYMIPYNMVENVKNTIRYGKKYIIIRINIISQILHANILIIDINNSRIIRFEPQGGVNNNDINLLDDIIFDEFKKDIYFKSYKYFKPIDYEPINGFQSLSQENYYLNIVKGDIGGFCVAWCLWFVENYIQNTNNKLLSDSNFKFLTNKLIKKLINSGYMISAYIRNYANYMHQKLSIYFIDKGLSFNMIQYENYTTQESDNLYNYLSLFFKDLYT